jgi:hypothetical protein
MRKYISTNRTANSRSRIYQFFMLFDGQKQATKRAVPPARKTYKALLGNPWNCWKARTFPGSECRAPLPAASTSPAKFELVPAVSLFRLEPLPLKKVQKTVPRGSAKTHVFAISKDARAAVSWFQLLRMSSGKAAASRLASE